MLWITQWDAISWISRWLRITFSIPSRKLCMGVKLLGFLSLSWWTVIPYYHTFSIIESPRHIVFFSLLYHNPYHNLCFYWHHVSLKKNTVVYSELNKKIFIVCYHLFTFTFISAVILYVFCFCTDTFRLRGSRISYEIYGYLKEGHVNIHILHCQLIEKLCLYHWRNAEIASTIIFAAVL